MIFTTEKGILNGVFTYYFSKHPKKLFKYVNVVSSGVETNLPWSNQSLLVDPSINGTEYKDNWCSPNITKSFVQIVLLKDTLILDSYTLKSRTTNSLDMPVSWNVYGSIDGVNFVLISTQNTRDIVSAGASKNFIPTTANFKMKYIKFEQTINSEKRYYFCLNKIELFGRLINEQRCTNKNQSRSPLHFIYIILMCY